mgnify:CR=1 FL=1
MRIVAGQFRSRRLHTPKNNDIRPTSDKVKGAIFSSLGPKASQGRFLDCYSGTGNMALEAISRGCEFAVLVDASKQACSIIKQNIQDLQVQKQTQFLRDLPRSVQKEEVIFVLNTDGYYMPFVLLSQRAD